MHGVFHCFNKRKNFCNKYWRTENLTDKRFDIDTVAGKVIIKLSYKKRDYL